MTDKNMVEALNDALFLAFGKDKDIVILGEDVGIDGGVFRVTENLFKKFGEKRVIDTGSAEAAIVGMALGMSLNGLRPIVEIQFSGFMYTAFQQIVSQVSRYRNRTRGNYTVPIVIRAPYGGGVNALEHHSESMEALYAHIPGIKLVIPSCPYDAKGLLLAAIKYNDPVIFLEPKKMYRACREKVPDEYYEEEIGKAKIINEGTDITLIGWGAMMPVLKDASEMSDASCEIIDLRTLYPWDKEKVAESVKKTGRAIIVHEAHLTGGFGGEIAASLQEECLMHLQAPIARVAAPDIIIPYFKSEHYYRPDAEKVAKKIKELMSN